MNSFPPVLQRSILGYSTDCWILYNQSVQPLVVVSVQVRLYEKQQPHWDTVTTQTVVFTFIFVYGLNKDFMC